MRMLLEASDKNSDCFPDKIQVDLEPRSVLQIDKKTVRYSNLLFIVLAASTLVTVM